MSARLVLTALLFAATCAAWVPAGFRVGDPMTHRPIENLDDGPLPILVMSGEIPRIERVRTIDVPAPPAGASYLIPVSRVSAVEAYLDQHQDPRAEGSWVLRVEELAPDRQRIEFYWVNDGYFGTVYEATPRSVRLLHRKRTGPAFGIFAGLIALGFNTAMWVVARGAIALVRRR